MSLENLSNLATRAGLSALAIAAVIGATALPVGILVNGSPAFADQHSGPGEGPGEGAGGGSGGSGGGHDDGVDMTMTAMMTMAMTMVATKVDRAVTTMAATIPAITGEKAKARVAPLKGAVVKAAWTPARHGPEREFPRWSLVD